MMKKSLTILFTLFITMSFAQTISRVEPPCWWIGMENPKLQLLVHGNEISKLEIEIDFPGVQLVGVDRVENPNYLFINLIIDQEAKPGSFEIIFKNPNGQNLKYTYTLHSRKSGSSERASFGASDAIYLVFPDRFANGDPSNDSVEGMDDKHNRKEEYARHGGDIQGIIDHIDYFTQLGVTALWVNPVLENNQPQWSYHGYAITDFYKVDPRMGTNELYKEFVEKSHSKGLKVIKDMVFNHCGNEHWWFKDLPMNDWLNQFPEFTRTNYRIPTTFDPHAAELDKMLMAHGWFDKHMPDLNQQNPFVAKYLIQNSIWWVEYANLDGIRMDTHPYCDKQFMAQWCQAVMDEYPNFNIVGETWINYPSWVAYWQKDANNSDGYNSNLKTVMDFPLMYAVQKAFDEKEGWDTGLHRLYEILAHDFVYKNTNDLLIFADNHDAGRFQRDSAQAIGRLKLALAFLLTTRGIPQLYYGTEIALSGDDIKGHGDIRRDFPGGWKEDKRSAFTEKGRTKRENEIWNFASQILKWRKNSSAIHNGKLIHFIPENEVYVYFRQNEEQTVMVIIHNGFQPKVLRTERFNEILSKFNGGEEIISGKIIESLDKIQLSPRTPMIIDLK